MLTALRRLVGSQAAPPRLWLFLLGALLLRLPAALFSRGYEFLDHQFQYVDPAYHLAFDADWWRPWEYERGMRSWVYPGLLAGVFRGLHALGLTDSELRMVATRALHALWSLLPLAALWHLVVRWQPLPQARGVLWFAALSGLFVYTGVQPNGPMWAAQASVAAVLCAHGPAARHAALAGVLLGLGVAGRMQDLAFVPAIGAWLVWRRRWSGLLAFSGAGLAMLVAQGLVDLCTWGTFLQSMVEYLRANVSEGRAADFGRAPAWQYLPAVAAVLAFVPFVPSASRAVVDGAKRYPLIAAAAVVYLVAHSLLDRKAVRFVMPGLMLASLLAAVGVGVGAHLRAQRRWLFVCHGALAVVLSLFYFHRGAVEAAKALAARPDFRDRLLLVTESDLSQAAVGGYYYLDRQRLRVSNARRGELGAALAAQDSAALYALVERHALEPAQIPAGWHADLVGEYRDWPEFSARRRRYVYHLRRG